MKEVITTEEGHEVHYIELAQEVSFFNKASVMRALEAIPANSKVIIDFSQSKSVANDVIELIKNYEINAKTKNVAVEKINFIEPKYYN
jgi:SulP family sulfate permease